MNPEFDLRLARVCLEASASAYGTQAFFETPLAHALVTTAGNGASIIAFRGTACLKDWVTDAKFVRTKICGSGTEVHSGFWEAWQSISKRVIDYIRSLDRGNVPALYITGHSLGGALAVLCNWELMHELRGATAVYTFGQPRVGNFKFAQECSFLFGHRHWRVIDELDVVARIPGVLIGYRHSGQPVLINAQGVLTVEPPLASLLLSDALAIYRDWRNGRPSCFMDHETAVYLRRFPQNAGLAAN